MLVVLVSVVVGMLDDGDGAPSLSVRDPQLKALLFFDPRIAIDRTMTGVGVGASTLAIVFYSLGVDGGVDGGSGGGNPLTTPDPTPLHAPLLRCCSVVVVVVAVASYYYWCMYFYVCSWEYLPCGSYLSSQSS